MLSRTKPNLYLAVIDGRVVVIIFFRPARSAALWLINLSLALEFFSALSVMMMMKMMMMVVVIEMMMLVMAMTVVSN